MKKNESEEDLSWLTEMSIAGMYDWEEGVESLGDITKQVIDLKWELIDVKKFGGIERQLEFRKLRNSLHFIIGEWYDVPRETKRGPVTDTKFKMYLRMELKRHKSLEKRLGYDKLINVSGVAIHKELSGHGTGTWVYKYLVNQLKYTLLSDEHVYFGARKLWAKLSQSMDIQVDIVNVKTKDVLSENVVLYHGQHNKDFNKGVYSYDGDKKDVRCVLTRIIK